MIEDENEDFTLKNIFLIFVISCVYILLISKISELISLQFDNDNNIIGTYVMIIYIISIMGIAFAYLFLNNDDKSDYVMNYSVNISSMILIVYTVTNYWNYLDDYGKFILLLSTFISIVYYLYKLY